MKHNPVDELISQVEGKGRHRINPSACPPNKRHTHANRNPNSNNQHLIRDPFNKTYLWYTTSDIIRLFEISRETILKHVSLGMLNPYVSEEAPKYYTKNETPVVSNWLTFPATTIYTYYTTIQNVIYKTSSPPVIPPSVIKSARDFISHYIYDNGSFQLRESELYDTVGSDFPIEPFGSRSYTFKEYRELCKKIRVPKS